MRQRFEILFLPWLFGLIRIPKTNLHRELFDSVAVKLELQTVDHWYSLNVQKFNEAAGNFILATYKGSLTKALQTIYPQFDWQPWKFSSVSRKYWVKEANRRKYFDWLGEHLGVRHWTDWYSVVLYDLKR